MALIKCPSCGKKVSDTTTRCIHCDTKLKDTNVDKILRLFKKNKKKVLLCLVILFFSVVIINYFKSCYFYKKAKEYASKSQFAFAIHYINKANSYKDSPELFEKYKKLFYQEQMGKVITNDNGISIAVKNDGTVVCSTDDYFKDVCNAVSKWTNVKYIYNYGSNIYAVKNDGTVVTYIDIVKESYVDFIREVEGWNDVEYLSSYSGYLVALHTDGTVSCSAPKKGKHGLPTKDDGICDVEGWNDVVYIEASSGATYALNKYGNLLVAGDSDVEYKLYNDNYIMISTGYDGFLGLKKNGKVIYRGDYFYDSKDWKDIVMISMGLKNIYGLQSNGYIVYDGEESFNNNYKNIVYIDAYGNRQLSTLDKNGNANLTIFWDSWDGEEYYKSYKNIKKIYSYESTIFAIKNNNTISCYNSQNNGCDIRDWKNLKAFK